MEHLGNYFMIKLPNWIVRKGKTLKLTFRYLGSWEPALSYPSERGMRNAFRQDKE